MLISGCKRTRLILRKSINGAPYRLMVQPCRMVATETALSAPLIIQSAIAGLQSMTGAPWWATIAMSTIFARLSLLPFVRMQLIGSQNLALALPEIGFLYQLLKKRLSKIKITDVGERLKVISVFFNGVGACLTLHEVSKMKVIAYPMVNIGLFMTFVYSVRDMIINSGNYALMDGGILWFVDLASKDMTFALPATAATLTYLGIDLAFGGPNGKNPTLGMIKDGCQCAIICSLPAVAALPAGVFCYWIPSTLFAIAQTQIIRRPIGQKILNIPPMKLPSRSNVEEQDKPN